MLEERTFWGDTNKIQTAIDRLREFCPTDPLAWKPNGYYFAFSGGKDSVAVHHLAILADVRFDAHFSVTTVDPPEILKFIRFCYPHVKWHRPDRSMWQLIIEKKIPPTRRIRYCCEALKETGGIGRVVLTGLRWEESIARKKRRLVETCTKHPSKTFVNPILDWTTEDVWEFIFRYRLPYSALYLEGFDRIGCVGCPMAGRKKRLFEFRRFPKFYKAYLRTFEKMLAARQAAGLDSHGWSNAEDVMRWWLSDRKEDPRQLQMFSMFE